MLDALTLDQMRTFVAVAEAGSFRAAAGRLSRIQSAVSHAIASLEVQLGVTLFDRSGRRRGVRAGSRDDCSCLSGAQDGPTSRPCRTPAAPGVAAPRRSELAVGPGAQVVPKSAGRPAPS